MDNVKPLTSYALGQFLRIIRFIETRRIAMSMRIEPMMTK